MQPKPPTPPSRPRPCSGCTLCCTLAFDAPDKPAGKPCEHCTGKGCKIYDKRPTVCRRFVCLWSASSALHGSLRPDLCGAFFEPVRGKPIMMVNVDPARPRSWEEGIVKSLIDRFVAQGTAVAIVVGKQNHFRLPAGAAFVPVWRDLLEYARASGVR